MERGEERKITLKTKLHLVQKPFNLLFCNSLFNFRALICISLYRALFETLLFQGLFKQVCTSKYSRSIDHRTEMGGKE